MTEPSVLPKISIVTPSFNQGAFIEEALWSVKNQDYPTVEHIVFDGASTDRTVDILRHYSDQPGWEHLRWVSERDRGQSEALNKGFRVATGDIVGWLNSDDRYREGCFETIVRGFAKHPQADVVYGDYTWIDEIGRALRIRREIRFNRFILHYLHMLYVPTTSSFFRRRIFEENNWIDLQWDYAMDYEFVVRLAQKGYTFQHTRGLLADFRVHGASKSVAFRKKQLAEHDSIACKYSPLLRRFKGKWPQKIVKPGLRVTARALRYSEKLIRGYYFEQYRPAWPGLLGWNDTSQRARP